jgi:predicted ester cyclase
MKTDSHGSAADDLAELAHTSSAEVHPRRLRLLAGRLPDEHTVPDRYPFETVSPTQDGYVERDGVRNYFAVYPAGRLLLWLARKEEHRVGGGEQGDHPEVFRRGSQRPDLDVLDELVAQDVVNHSATDEHKHGIDGFRHVSEWGIALLPDGRYELVDMIAEGGMVACRVRVSGTMQGELFGVAPTGKSFTAEHVHWHRVAGGKLVER